MTTEVVKDEGYLETFAQFVRESGRGTPRWLRELRDRAFARFSAVGFPTVHDEDWRFTNLAALSRLRFELGRGAEGVDQLGLAQWQIAGSAARLVFVNGRFVPGLSALAPLLNGVRIGSLEQEIAKRPDTVAESLGRYADMERDPFVALNTAFSSDGALVFVPRGVALEQPIHLLFVATEEEAPVMSHPRNLIVVGEGAQASIVEDYVSLGAEVPAFSNSVTELVAGENASVMHTMIEREHTQSYNVSTLRIHQDRSANVASHSILLGGALVRNNVHPVLAGEGADCLINGLFIGGGRQHLDNYMLVEHASPHCASRQFYNGILDDKSHGVFHGRIIVHKDAQKTDAKQTNRNLLLCDDAQIDTKPQLEIYADDVKCTHGATIGQIEDDALFYLRSRGIGEVEARRLLLAAFARECLDRMPAGAVRNYAQGVIDERLETIATSPIAASSVREGLIERNWREVE